VKSLHSVWNEVRAKIRRTGVERRTPRGAKGFERRLRLESLEDRQMLSTTWTVTTDHDELDLTNGNKRGQNYLFDRATRGMLSYRSCPDLCDRLLTA
jgi:hypothetical protein